LKRRRLTFEEEARLEEIFQQDPIIWDKSMKVQIAKSLSLDITKVYKWNWERMRKFKRGE